MAFLVPRVTSILLLAVLVGGSACGRQPAATPRPLPGPERSAIADTLRRLYRESSRIFDSDLPCEEIVDRLSAEGGRVSFVTQGRVVEIGNREGRIATCRMIKRDRLSAHEEIEEQTVEVLGRDAAVVVTRSVYTVRFRDGRTTERPQVVTTVWLRGVDGWRRVHLHESWPTGQRPMQPGPDTAGGPQAPSLTTQSPPPPPPAPVRPIADTLHGVVVVDPYRWMEQGDEELTDWLKAQDAYARSLLARIPGREALLADLRELNTDAMTISQVRRLGNGWVYLEREPGAGVARLVLRDGATGPKRVLVDPATLSGGAERLTIDAYELSPRGNAIAYLAPADGGFFGTLRVVDVATGHTLPDSVGRVFDVGSWRPDGRAFTYTRLRDLPPDAPPLEQDLCPMTYLHVLGTDPATDEAVAGCDVSPRIKVTETTWARVLFFAASRHAVAWVPVDPAVTGLDLYTAPVDSLAGADTPWRVLARAEEGISEVVLRGDTAFMVTSREAPRRRVVRTSVLAPDLANAEVLVPESEAVITRPFSATGTSNALHLAEDALYVRFLDAGVSRLLRVPVDGAEPDFVQLPFPGAIPEIASDPMRPGLVFELVSWLKAPRFYEWHPNSGVQDLRLAPPHPAERPGYEATRVHVPSEDGTMVPLTLLHGAGLRKDRSHPVRLQGYGAYGIVPEPGFRPTVLAWLARGGVDAICHVRGGGDYGEEWHRAGQKENKANTVSDLIACAEYLLDEGYTRHERLAGLGASAGGLTIGGAITRQPGLFGVAQAAVPVADLLRLEFGRNGPGNVPEFGTVTDPEQFGFMLPVSPYHQIRPGTAYPAILVTTAINDIAVPPWHPAKLVARLQAATSSGRPVLLRVDWGSGHFGGTTTSDNEARIADAYAFMLWQMGVEGFQPPGSGPGG